MYLPYTILNPSIRIHSWLVKDKDKDNKNTNTNTATQSIWHTQCPIPPNHLFSFEANYWCLSFLTPPPFCFLNISIKEAFKGKWKCVSKCFCFILSFFLNCESVLLKVADLALSPMQPHNRWWMEGEIGAKGKVANFCCFQMWNLHFNFWP